MANTIRIKRSTGSGAPTTLQNAELAFTEGTKTLYVGVGTGGGGGSATTVEAIGGLGAFVSLGSTAQTIEGVKTFTGAIVLGTPGSGTLTNCTGLPVSTGVSGLGTGVATFLGTPSSANLASAVTGGTGTGALVFATSPTLVSPALGTPTALVGTNISGTGASFTAGAVTNAGLTGEVTTSGLAATISNSAVIGKVLTGFTSGAGAVGAGDTILQAIQKINGNTSAGVAAAGSLTGATLASNVLASSLTSVGTLSALTVTAAIVGSVTGNAGTVTTNANLTGAITSSGNTTSLGTASFSSANLAGALTDKTGTGVAVFATSPTLVTPTIGAATATSVNKVTITAPATGSTLTVAEGKTLTASNTLTFTGTDASSVAFGTGGTVVYTSGLGTGVATFLATPSSANLASAVTGETGTGSLVFSADPTFTGTLNCAALTSTGNVTVGGDLLVNGTTTTINSTVTTLDDPIITLGGDGNGINDDKDRGVEFKWNDGTAKVGFFGFDESTGYFTFIPQATNSSEVFTGTKGDIQATNFRGALIGNADTVTTNANLTGAITSSGNTTSLGTASFSSANLAGALTDKTGTGVAVFATSPTLVTPTIGAATATSVNKVTITAPATGSTITVADGKTLTASNTLTFTGTDASSVAFGAGGTVVYTSGLGTGVATFLATPSSANLASAVTGETGTGALVFATSPTLDSPALGTPTALVGTNISGTGASFTAGTATNATNVAITSDNTGTSYFIPFVTAATGNNGLKADAGTGANGLTYVPSTATLTTGNVSATQATLQTLTSAGDLTITTTHGSTNDVTIQPYGVLILSPTSGVSSGGTFPSVVVDNTDAAAGLVTIAGGDLYLSTKTNSGLAITPVNIIFEGATADGFETTLTVTDPTADRTITLPDATDTLVGKATTDTLTNKTLTTPKIAQINDTNGLAVLKTGTTASAVNEVTITNNIATQAPHVSATGTDTNISLHLAPKGTGSYVVVENGTDGTKQIAIGVAGATTGTTTFFNAAQTANRTITLPNATDTLVGKATTDTLTNKTWNSTVIAGEYGGTGVANTSKTITLGGNLTTSGAFTTTLTATANTSVTLPTSGTLLNDAATIDGGSY